MPRASCTPAYFASSPSPFHKPEFIERVELLYNETAKQAGCYLASAVGFDSVPGDLGVAVRAAGLLRWVCVSQAALVCSSPVGCACAYVQYTMSLFKPPARCTVVETALTIRGGPSGFKGHYPTYESAVHGFASAGELRKLRKEAEQASQRRRGCLCRGCLLDHLRCSTRCCLHASLLQSLACTHMPARSPPATAKPQRPRPLVQKRGRIDLKVPGPKPPRQTGAAFDPRLQSWTFPFMGKRHAAACARC